MMEIAQLQKQFRAFKIKEGHPKLFLFLNTVVVNDEPAEYSTETTKQFMKSAFQACESHAKRFKKAVEGIL